MQAGGESKGWRLRIDFLSQPESQMELGGSCISNSINKADPRSKIRDKFRSLSALELWDYTQGVGPWWGM